MSLKLEEIIVINLLDKIIEGNYNKPVIVEYDEALLKEMLKRDLEKQLMEAENEDK